MVGRRGEEVVRLKEIRDEKPVVHPQISFLDGDFRTNKCNPGLP